MLEINDLRQAQNKQFEQLAQGDAFYSMYEFDTDTLYIKCQGNYAYHVRSNTIAQFHNNVEVIPCKIDITINVRA